MARSHNRKRATPRVGDGAQIITIHIPAENGVVALHAHLAAYYSDYFRAALSLPMEEARTLSFRLDEPATDYTVACFAAWLYAAASEKRAAAAYLCDGLGLDTPAKVVDAWLLGDYLRAPGYMNQLTALLCRLLRDAPPPPRFELARQLARLPEGSGVWRLLLAFHARRLGDDPAARHDENGPAAAAAAAGRGEEEAWGVAALRELNHSLAALLAAARSCVRKLDDAGYVGAAMQAEIEAVLGNGSLDPKQYLEADGSR